MRHPLVVTYLQARHDGMIHISDDNNQVRIDTQDADLVQLFNDLVAEGFLTRLEQADDWMSARRTTRLVRQASSEFGQVI